MKLQEWKQRLHDEIERIKAEFEKEHPELVEKVQNKIKEIKEHYEQEYEKASDAQKEVMENIHNFMNDIKKKLQE